MNHKVPDLTIRHRRIENQGSAVWDLTPLIYKGGTISKSRKRITLTEIKKLPLRNNIELVEKIKDHAEGLLETGYSKQSVSNAVGYLKRLYDYVDSNEKTFETVDDIRKMLFAYSEYQFTRANLNKIKHQSAYDSISSLSAFLNGLFEDLDFDIDQTRLIKEKKSRRALSRSAEKSVLSNAAGLANFCFEITQNFSASILKSGTLPIIIDANNHQVNLTPPRIFPAKVNTDFTQTEAYLAFNYRVSAEALIFIGMTVQNQEPTYNLRREKFDYKPLGEKYEVREYKHRRGGEVLFKIPRPYKPHFERYLELLDEYAPDSQWLFPFLNKNFGFRKRTSIDTNKFKYICSRYNIPWIRPSAFRQIGENILMRLASDEQTAADYTNHAVATFRQSYEFPSLQRAIIEIGRFWDKSDPLLQVKTTVSLFNSPCNGIPLAIKNASTKLPKPDCVNPSGCIGCMHYRDEESLDYVWGLHSFKYLKMVESSSHRTTELKPSNIAIDWACLKINWFRNSKIVEHREWVEESEARIEEGYYHPNWSRKIKKYE